jgi:hypothetical protein
MKLGIVVVYLVKQEDGPLLYLHLAQIEKNTKVPYTIYAGAARLLPEFRHKMSQNPRIRVCDLEQTHLRSSEEHAFYLGQLIDIALADGSTHIATLHVDSFPVRTGWAEILAGKLSDKCVLAGVMRDRRYDCKPNTACMFFSRHYFLGYRPAFLVTEAERALPEYREYLQAVRVLYDSGIGYGFQIFRDGLSWYPLERSSKADHFSLGAIFGDMIFHLGSLNPDVKACPGDEEQFHALDTKRKAAVILRKTGIWLLPLGIRTSLKKILPRKIMRLFYPQHVLNEEALLRIRKRLLADPDRYIRYLRAEDNG